MEILIILLIVAAMLYYFNNFTLKVKEIEVVSSKIPKGFDGYRILHISDLHNSCYGEGNRKLIRKINRLNPDVIFYTGDMIDKQSPGKDHFSMLIEGMAHKYPAYFSDGNHEDELTKEEKKEFISLLNRAGVRHLDDEKIFLEREKEKIPLYGLRLPREYLRNTYDENGRIGLSKKELEKRFGRIEQGFTMQLAHNPLYFNVYAQYGIDLTFSGHVHGGVVRLPLIGGILSPDRTFFPKYSKGLYKEEDKKIVVSPGIGGVKLRVFNRPTMYVVKLLSKES
jgi:uncharacterized protein